MTPARLPHSDIPGSMLAYSSPRLFAVNHVLLRLLMPRHPPYALIILTCSLSNTLWLSLLALFSNSKSRFLIALSKIVILPYSLLLQLERSHYFYAVVKDLLITFNELFGGDERNRTADPLLARQVLSQLSYIPSLKTFLIISLLLLLLLSHIPACMLLSHSQNAPRTN